MSHFTPGKTEAVASRPPSPPDIPDSGKKNSLMGFVIERWALNLGAVHQPELCLGE